VSPRGPRARRRSALPVQLSAEKQRHSRAVQLAPLSDPFIEDRARTRRREKLPGIRNVHGHPADREQNTAARPLGASGRRVDPEPSQEAHLRSPRFNRARLAQCIRIAGCACGHLASTEGPTDPLEHVVPWGGNSSCPKMSPDCREKLSCSTHQGLEPSMALLCIIRRNSAGRSAALLAAGRGTPASRGGAARRLRLQTLSHGLACVLSTLMTIGCETDESVGSAGEDASRSTAECPRSSDASVSPGTYTSAALPEGPCTGAAVKCEVLVRDPCKACPSVAGPVEGYACQCLAGAWACSIESKAASLCQCDLDQQDAASDV
jgi:hypothetical protein